MAFKEVASLDCDVTIALGGMNKQTKKPNPKKIEGFFLGSRKTTSKKAKDGISLLHIFQTANGNVGVWGKTDLDRKLASVPLGSMTRVTQSGMIPTQRGDMYKFKVEVDSENTIEVTIAASDEGIVESEDETAGDESVEEEAVEEAVEEVVEEADAADEAPYVPPTAPKVPAAIPDAARQAKVKELLSKNRTKSA